MAKNGSAAIALRKRRLTKLYNMRGTAAGAWLDDLHRKLDEAVAATAQTGAACEPRLLRGFRSGLRPRRFDATDARIRECWLDPSTNRWSSAAGKDRRA